MHWRSRVPVVRDEHQRAVVCLQRDRQRLAHLDVEMVGRFVEQQHRRARTGNERQDQAGFLATGQRAHRALDHVATEAPSAQVVAGPLLPHALSRRRVQRRQRRAGEPQRLHLVLGKIAHLAVPATHEVARDRPMSPANAFSSVVLPAPLTPSTPMRSPG